MIYPPALPKYRIKRDNKIFTIEKLTEVKIKSKNIFEFILFGKYRLISEYKTISEVFDNLDSAKNELKKIVLENEIKYYFF